MATKLNVASGGVLRTLSGGVPTYGKALSPQNITASIGDTTASVSFTTPSNNGGQPITGYVVAASTNGGTVVSKTLSSSTFSATLEGLANGIAYTITASAVTSQGNGTAANGGTFTPAYSGGAFTKPSAANTGCRTPAGSLTSMTGAAVASAMSSGTRSFSNLLITGQVTVGADNVTFTDCVFQSSSPGTQSAYWMIYSNNYNALTTTYCTFNGQGSVANGAIDTAVIMSNNGVLSYCNISGCQDGIHPAQSGQIIGNYVHDGVAPSGAHADAIQLLGDTKGLYVARNTFDYSNTANANSALQLGSFLGTNPTVDAFVLEDNYFNGGGYTLSGDFTASGGSAISYTNTIARRNKFGLSNAYNSVLYPGGIATILTANNTNVWEVTGTTTGTGRSVVAGTPVS